jgi:hypothetical protein
MIDDKRKNISLKDSGNPRKYIAQNPHGKGVVVYHIDGGLISDPKQSKCDYGLLTESDHLYLIELKGADYSHALEQITNTINLLMPNVASVHARVVLSKVRTPNIKVAGEKKLQKLLMKYNGDLIKKENQLVETI